MTHEIEWGQVIDGTQVWRNGFAWIVELKVGNQVTLYSPSIDKRHTGTPPSWNKVEVLTADDKRYIRSRADDLPTPPTVEPIDVAGALVQIRLGASIIAVRDESGLRFEPWESMDVAAQRLHLLLAHRLDSGNVTDVELNDYHLNAGNADVPHSHGRL